MQEVVSLVGIGVDAEARSQVVRHEIVVGAADDGGLGRPVAALEGLVAAQVDAVGILQPDGVGDGGHQGLQALRLVQVGHGAARAREVILLVRRVDRLADLVQRLRDDLRGQIELEVSIAIN